jgi:hypothetical protein
MREGAALPERAEDTSRRSYIWRTANLIVSRCGREALFVAARRADECLAMGDLDGHAVWRSIFGIVIELIGDEPR